MPQLNLEAPLKLPKLSILSLSFSMLVLSGCGDDGSPAPNATNPVSNVYVTSNDYTTNTPSILGYSLSASPTASLTLTGTQNDSFRALAIDASGNLYTGHYVSTSDSWVVDVYARAANTTPATTIRSFSSTAVGTIRALTVDKNGNVFVSSNGMVLEFAPNTTGVATPTVTLPIVNSNAPLATDLNGNFYTTGYLSSSDQHGNILVYSAGFNASSSPARTIVPSTPVYIYSVALDKTGNVYALVLDDNNQFQVQVYSSTANGTSTPTRTIAGASTGFLSPMQVLVDATGAIYVEDTTRRPSASPVSGSAVVGVPSPRQAAPGIAVIRKFDASASGNIAPVLNFTTTASVIYPGMTLY